MQKTQKIEKLFEQSKEILVKADVRYRNGTQVGVCKDGIINEAVFEKQKHKIVFLLKETNGTKKDGTAEHRDWNYRAWLQHQQANGEPGNEENTDVFYASTFTNLCMWLDVFDDCMSGIQCNFADYTANGRLETDSLRKNLNKTAIVNLKKTWGGGSTDWKALNDYLSSPGISEMLRNEIDHISPNIVICGGKDIVFDFALKVFGGSASELSVDDGAGIRYFIYKDVLFLDFYHPACRKSHEFLFDFAAKCFSAIKKML